MEDLIKIKEYLINFGLEFKDIACQKNIIMVTYKKEIELINIIKLILYKKYYDIDVMECTNLFITDDDRKLFMVFLRRHELEYRFTHALDLDILKDIYIEVHREQNLQKLLD